MVGHTIQKILDHTKNIEVQNTTSAGANYEYQPTVNNIRCSRYRLRRFYGFEILCYSLLFIQQVVFSLWSEHRASTCDVMFITKSYLQETHIIVAFIDDSSLKCCSFSTNKQSILDSHVFSIGTECASWLVTIWLRWAFKIVMVFMS